MLKTLSTLVLGLWLAFPSTQVAAQSGSDAPPVRRAPDLTAVDLEAFLDGIVPLALKSNDITGTVIAVVKDGKLLLAKGYGYADRDRRRPVLADSTLFRVASISKLFTATAVMQLVEQGKLDLDEEIDRYLDFAVPRKYQEKITLRHLLTHTAGFEEAFKKLPADSGKSVPLKEWATRTTPPQLYRPGTITSYSNYGTDLAGYIVEHVSGTPFPEYIRLHILDPLGMRQSSITEPLPPELRAQLSLEYPTASDSAGEFEVLMGEPSGNMSATATDMAKFAIAHLALGQYDSIQILRPETARLMGMTQFRTHPRVPGMGLGFFEEDRNGYRILGHGGDLSRFHSHLSLLMDHGVAFFISVNSTGRGTAFYSLREAVRDAFLDRYFPRTVPIEPVIADAPAVAAQHVGAYTLSRRGASSIGGIFGLLIDLDVSANPDGSIQVGLVAGPNGLPIRWYPIDATTYRNADGSQLLGYVPGSDGLPDRFGFLGGHELHRVGALDSRSFNLPLLFGSLGIFAATLLFWPFAAVIRRRQGVNRVDDGVSPAVRGMTRLAAVAAIGFVFAIGMFVMRGMEGSIDLDSRSDVWLGLIRAIGLVAILGTVTSIVALLRSVRVGRNGVARFKYLLLTLAGVGFSWFVLHWNLVSWNFR
ncbi:MAG: serine hydrolase domain-containing protein, partial [Gemmatimonadales bacterium]